MLSILFKGPWSMLCENIDSEIGFIMGNCHNLHGLGIVLTGCGELRNDTQQS